MVIRESLEPAIFSIMFPRTAIDIYIEIVQADGGTRCVGIIAASLALADAGVPLKDLVAGCAAGKIDIMALPHRGIHTGIQGQPLFAED